jgi:carboxypeptidase T
MYLRICIVFAMALSASFPSDVARGERQPLVQHASDLHRAPRPDKLRLLSGTTAPCFPGARTMAQVIAFMDTLRMLYPNVVSQKWSLGQSHEGRDIWCFRMSDNPDVDLNRPATLFDALHHPGECSTFEMTIRLAEYFAQKYGTDPEITDLLDRREVYFVPIVNPDGLAFIEAGNSWPKKNRRDNGDGTFGVNLNRNYPYMWGTTGHPDSDSTFCACYWGPSAGSEPETQAIMGLINSQDFVTHQSYHAPGSHTFYPWAYTTDSTPDSAIYTHMGETMTRRNGYFHMPVSDFGVFSGTTIDWSYGAHGIFAFTNEVGILSDNLWPAIYLIQVAGPFVKAIDPAVVGGDADGHLDPGETAGLSFSLFNEGVRKDATGVTVRLSSDDPYVQILEAERTVGTIGAFSTVDFSGAPFAATVDPSCPVGRMIGVDVMVVEPDGTRNYVVPYVVGGHATLFSDDFETGTDGWTLTGTWGLTTANSNSPTNSLTDSPGGNYMDLDTTSATITQPITASGLSLSFWHFYQTEEIFDFVEVQVSSDGGPWTKMARYTGTNSGWERLELSLDEYAGKPVQIRFELLADWSEVDDGWYIDDVVIEGAVLTNLTPAPPNLISPTPGEVVSSDPTLIVANSLDPDGPGPLTYGFRVYGDSLCTNLVVGVDGIAEGAGQTQWTTSPPLPDGTYWWRAYAADSTEWGLMGEKRIFERQGGSTGIPTEPLASNALAQNYPNPFNPVTTIRYSIKDQGPVGLRIYDTAGRLVRILVDANQAPRPGGFTATWDGKNESGDPVSSGVYYYRLSTKDFSQTKKMVLLK